MSTIAFPAPDPSRFSTLVESVNKRMGEKNLFYMVLAKLKVLSLVGRVLSLLG